MFKKIALLAGAGALAFGAVAPMAAAAPVNLSPLDNINAGTYYSKPDVKGCSIYKDQAVSLAKTYLVAAKDELAKASGEWEDARFSKEVADAKDTAASYLSKEEMLSDEELNHLASIHPTLKGMIFAHQRYFVAKHRYTRLVSTIDNYVTYYQNCLADLKVDPTCTDVRAAVSAFGALVDSDKLIISETTKAQTTDNSNAKNPKNLPANESVAWKLLADDLNPVLVTAKENLKKDTAKLNEWIAKGVTLKCPGFDKAMAPKKDTKKVADNKVNNAAVKEGLAATGSAASVAALLSALAVLAGGAFVGIRRFNS